MNTVLLSQTYLFGLGYCDSQLFTNCSAMCPIVLLLIQISSTRLVTRAIQVRALNSQTLFCIVIFYRSIKSTQKNPRCYIIFLTASICGSSLDRCIPYSVLIRIWLNGFQIRGPHDWICICIVLIPLVYVCLCDSMPKICYSN